MTSFDESLHPRERSGEFATKVNTAPSGSLTAAEGDDLPTAFYSVWDGAPEQAREAHARGLWSAIAEPSDKVLGATLRIHGGSTALEVLRSDDPDAVVTAQLGIEDESAVPRWRARLHDAGRVFADAERAGLTLHTAAEGGIPARFQELGDDAPVALWARGDASLLHDLDNSVTISGARAATNYGSHVSRELGAKAAEDGRVLVSGGSYGVADDSLRGAVAAGGRSVVISASGADRAYPAGSADLFDSIVSAGGTVISETPPGAVPTRWRMMAQARLLASASDATIIVEAGFHSGSLLAAERAADLGRPVYAVPGPITSAASVGTNMLIRERKAKLLTSLDDLRDDDAAHV